MTDPHMHLPTRDNANVCGVEGCGQPWNSINHQPSLALQRLSELPPDLRPLAQHERASGPPSVPVQRANGAPATHTGRPAMHSGAQYVPADAKWIMCPERFRTQGRPTLQCPYSTPLRAEMADHLARTHEYTEQAAGFYLAHPWFANEQRSEWVARTAHLRKTVTVQDSDVFEVCTHPNGFGPNGCPCGASAPDEDAPETVRNLDTGKDVPATRCPECQEPVATDLLLLHMREVEASDQEDIDAMAELLGLPTLPPPSDERYDHPDGSPIWNHSINCPECGDAFVKHNARRHLQTVHQWTGDMWSDWAESVNFLELPTVPKSILDDMEAVGKRAEREMANFLNPDISMEQIMTDAQNAAEIDPTELNKAMDQMAPAYLEQLLTEWWMDKAEEEVRQVVPKAVEYGALDLVQIGQDLALTMKRTVTDAEAAELGIYFYLRGKLARWTDAVITGRQVSDDTLHDIGVYVRMAQRVRDAGGWPGLPTQD